MALSAAIAAIVALITALFKIWQDKAPERNKEQRYAEIQQGRQDIAAGDAAAVNSRIDKLFTAAPGTPADPPGRRGHNVTTGRIDAILGVADPRRNAGEDSGKS